MELSELIAYAAEKYRIPEQHKWTDFPGFSVLCHPRTGKWLALLMRQWDEERGEWIERCDLKYPLRHPEEAKPYLGAPLRMKGSQWLGIAFTGETERAVVLRLFDRAFAAANGTGCTLVLDPLPVSAETVYRDTALPFSDSGYRPAGGAIPEKLRQFRRMLGNDRGHAGDQAGNFYRQAVFMRDYEDELPWEGEFVCYYPSYRDLNVRQLRGYFGWRTRARRGEYLPIPSSAAYLYVYELLNGIGGASPEDCLQKLLDFERGYLGAAFGERRMRRNLRQWMPEFAVIHELPPELARQAADPELIENDAALDALRNPEAQPDETLFSALLRFGGKKTADSPVLSRDPERGRHLFCEVWRAACAYQREGKTLFTLCFGEPAVRPWYPLSNAIYYPHAEGGDRDYALTACRRFRRRGGAWETESFDSLRYDRALLRGLLHETDARLRRYLKSGHALREDPAYAWCTPYIDAVIEADKRASIPALAIDLSGLERIRLDAIATRESLLTEEEREESEETAEAAVEAVTETETAADALPLDAVQIRILRTLLSGGDASKIIRDARLTPSLAADLINEALFDELGDTALACEGERLSVLEEYREELAQWLGGTGYDG